MNGSSRVNKAYQHSQRTKTQDSEYVRYVDSCDGLPFTSKQTNRMFEQVIVDCYATCSKTVNEILDGWLYGFSLCIVSELSKLTLKFEGEDYGKITTFLKKPDFNFGAYSFCNYVAKRLVLLRKAGKLIRKKLPNRKTSVRKPKKIVNNISGGSLVRKVE